MKILLLSYLFNPNAGSELGVVKKWSDAYSKLGHDLTVWTSLDQKRYFNDYEFTNSKYKINFIGRKVKRLVESPQSTYDLLKMKQNINKWYKQLPLAEMSQFDMIQHVTLSTIRINSPLTYHDETLENKLKVWGPLGGGQVSNMKFVPRREVLLETVRNSSIRILPFFTRLKNLERSQILVMVTNEDTYKYASRSGFKNVRLELSDGVEQVNVVENHRTLSKTRINGAINFLWAGRVVGSKRLDIAILMISRLLEEGVNARLNVAGDGPALSSMKKLAIKLNLKDHVIFHGRVSWNRVNDLIDSSDFTVFSSIRDNSAPIILESAARAVPSIAIRIQGVSSLYPESVAIGPTELKSAKDMHKQLASYVTGILGNPSEYERASQNCLLFARSQTWDEKARRVLDSQASDTDTKSC